MNYSELSKKLNQLRIEDFIWLVYIGIIFVSWRANEFERKYFIYNDLECRKTYRKLMILIFSVLVVIYFYFLKDSYDDLVNINPCDSSKKRNLIFLSFIGSLLIVLSGIIFLYIVIADEQIDVEISFN